MTSTELVSLLRSEAQALISNATVERIEGITFSFSNGCERTVKFNQDKSWRLKPTEVNGFVRIEWTCDSSNSSTLMGNLYTYTIMEQVETVFIDPSQLVNFRFNYTIKRETNVSIESDNSGEGGE